MIEKISFTVNQKPVTVEVEPDMLVLDLLREVLNLTGTKHGCDNSTCGTCTILVNGKATKSCNLPVKKIAGAEVVTIEGLAQGTQLHPVQKSISESGAIQCGFCTPGIVMELVGLFDEKPEASQTEIESALNKHLCRCTGYEPIRDGALMAQQLLKDRK
jgi:carbon-monoxide dehydrogenase small subunit